MLEYDVEMFEARVKDMIPAGIPIKEAKKAILEAFPEPSLASEIAPLIQNKGIRQETRRYLFAWETLSPEKNITLTLFLDRDGNVARWTVGSVVGSL